MSVNLDKLWNWQPLFTFLVHKDWLFSILSVIKLNNTKLYKTHKAGSTILVKILIKFPTVIDEHKVNEIQIKLYPWTITKKSVFTTFWLIIQSARFSLQQGSEFYVKWQTYINTWKKPIYCIFFEFDESGVHMMPVSFAIKILQSNCAFLTNDSIFCISFPLCLIMILKYIFYLLFVVDEVVRVTCII